MKSYEDMTYHPLSEQLVTILQEKTLNQNPLFFRLMVAYYLCKVASMMRCSVDTLDRGEIPVNLYVINLASSGQGKGHSMNILEDQIIDQFRTTFLETTFPDIATLSLAQMSVDRATKKGTDPDGELVRLQKDFDQAGEVPFASDSATVPAVKQLRQKLLMAGAGSINLEIDEIGSNLLGNADVLTTFLELFDVGKTKNKLTKNTNENTRGIDINGRTPANMLLFGTPSKLLDGGKTEDEFFSLLETGYARRCLFGLQTKKSNETQATPQQIYDLMTNHNSAVMIDTLRTTISHLAERDYFNLKLKVSKEVTMLYIAYKMDCEQRAEALPDYKEIQKAELCHRYFKAIKLAGAYAFVDRMSEVTEDHLYYAIKLTEDSGECLQKIMTREKTYARLAKYFAGIDKEVTHADIMEELPCYKGGETYRKEMLNLAIAYGYRNNIIIKKSITDGIEFFTGETLKPTNMDKLVVSYSTQLAEGYLNEEITWDQLAQLTQTPGYHFVNHHLNGGYRNEENCIPRFNLLILDVDKGMNMDLVKILFQKYSYIMYTTKRHSPTEHRFRLIFPMSHQLKLGAEEYTEFMKNIFDWLPFKVDSQVGQRSRKWLPHQGQLVVNSGELLDVLPFIPKTHKCEEQKQINIDYANLNNLERWFVAQSAPGNRSNNIIRYALMLVDGNLTFPDIQNKVLALNARLPQPLSEAEILSTVMTTVKRKLQSKTP